MPGPPCIPQSPGNGSKMLRTVLSTSVDKWFFFRQRRDLRVQTKRAINSQPGETGSFVCFFVENSAEKFALQVHSSAPLEQAQQVLVLKIVSEISAPMEGNKRFPRSSQVGPVGKPRSARNSNGISPAAGVRSRAVFSREFNRVRKSASRAVCRDFDFGRIFRFCYDARTLAS